MTKKRSEVTEKKTKTRSEVTVKDDEDKKRSDGEGNGVD